MRVCVKAMLRLLCESQDELVDDGVGHVAVTHRLQLSADVIPSERRRRHRGRGG